MSETGNTGVEPDVVSRRNRRRSALAAVAVGGIAAVVGLAVYVGVRSRIPVGRQLHLTSGSATLAPEGETEARPMAEAPLEARVEIPIESEPPGATVLVDGEVLGKTPLTWRAAESPEPASITFRLRGYRDKTLLEKPRAGLAVKAVLFFGPGEGQPRP